MLNKLLVLFLMICVTFVPTIVFAEVTPLLPPKGRITGLRYKQPAPYSGVLLNSIAAASLLTNRNFSEKQWQLKLKYELAKETARLQLIIETQKVTYASLQEKHKTLLGIKNKEIERLTEIAAKKRDYTIWWTAGGIIVGIALTIAVVYAVRPQE